MYTCYWVGHTEGVRESGGMLTDLEYTLDGLHIVISFCLGLSVVGLWLRRGWGLILSLRFFLCRCDIHLLALHDSEIS